MDLKDFLQSRFATVLLAGMLILVLFVTGKLLLQKSEVDREIAQLQSRAERINKDNQELAELIKYFNTEEYAERQAREKLNLKKEGEFVVGLPDGSSDEGDVLGEEADTESNPEKWFSYFFGIK